MSNPEVEVYVHEKKSIERLLQQIQVLSHKSSNDVYKLIEYIVLGMTAMLENDISQFCAFTRKGLECYWNSDVFLIGAKFMLLNRLNFAVKYLQNDNRTNHERWSANVPAEYSEEDYSIEDARKYFMRHGSNWELHLML